MRRSAEISAILCSLIFYGFAAAFSYQNEPDGFRDVKWGAPLDTVQGLRETRRDDPRKVAFYARDEDKMEVGGIPVESIEYGFYDGRFLVASVRTADYKTFSQLRVSCTNMFGLGSVMNKGGDLYVWPGVTAIVRLRYDADKNKGVLTITSMDVYKRMQDNRPHMDPVEWRPSKEGF